MFDAISGIFSSGASFVSDFVGGAFASIDETFRGGTLSSPGGSLGRQAGIGLGGIFTDIGTSFLTGSVQALTGARPAPLTQPRAGAAPTGHAPSETLGDMLARIRAEGGALPGIAGHAPAFTAADARVTDPRFQDASLGGLLGNIAGGALQEFLGPPTRLGRAVENIFGFDPGGAMAHALPGGAAIGSPFPAVSPQGGRLFGATQNMMTGAVSVRAIKEIQAINPMTGRVHTWREKGRCLLWSDDLSAVKRVAKVARRAGRRRPR
ncbi:MAG: hypothetical protein V3T07_01790 [Myxococcota bacterium]